MSSKLKTKIEELLNERLSRKDIKTYYEHDEEDFDIIDYCGHNFDDALDYGQRLGRGSILAELKEILNTLND